MNPEEPLPPPSPPRPADDPSSAANEETVDIAPEALAEAEAEEPRGVPPALLALFVPTLLFFAYLLIPIGQRFDSALRYPFEIDGEEGFVYLDAVEMRLGRPIYHSLEEEPFVVGNYPPLFAWALSKFMDPAAMSLQAGRALVLLASVLIVQLLVSIVYTRTRRYLPALLAPLLFLITYEFHNWSAFCRVDLPALALSLLGLLIFISIEGRWGASVAAVVFVLAAYTRLTSILAPAACCLSMLCFDRRRLIWFLIPYAGLGLGALAALDRATGGAFFENVVRDNRNLMDWVSFGRVMQHEIFYFYRWWILALAVGSLTLLVARRRGGDETPIEGRFRTPGHARGLLGFYFILGAISLAGFAKVGSAPNYALEALAAAAIFGMETLGRLCDAAGGIRSPRRLWARLGVTAMGVGLLGHAAWIQYVGGDLFSSRNPTAADHQVARVVLNAVRSAQGEVLTEFPAFSLLAGKRVTYEPFIMSRLASEGKWDEEKILASIRRRRYSLILTSQDLREVEQGKHLWRFTPAMARAIIEYYSLEYVTRTPAAAGLRQTFYLWLPKEISRKGAPNKFIARRETGRSAQRRSWPAARSA